MTQNRDEGSRRKDTFEEKNFTRKNHEQRTSKWATTTNIL